MNHYMSSDYRGASEAGAGAYFKPNAVLVPLTLMHGRLAALLEKHAVLQSPSQVESLVKIFVHATKVCGCTFLVGLAG